jgi:CDI immunity protein
MARSLPSIRKYKREESTMNIKLQTSQMIAEDHFPVLAFFNAISDDSFMRVIENLSQEIGYAINDVDCTFPSDLEPDEDPFNGVMFALHDEEIIINHVEFYYYLELASLNFIRENPDYKSNITIILNLLKKKYTL